MKKLLLFGAIALSINLFAQVPNYIPTSGLVGWYEFSGNSNDGSADLNHGTNIGSPTLSNDRFGNSNSAYSFDGVDDYISLPSGNTTSLDVTGEFSVSIWLKTSQTSYGSQITFGDNNISSEGFLFNHHSTNNLNNVSINTGGAPWIWTNSVMNDNQWNNFILVLSSDSLCLYKNGVLEHTTVSHPLCTSWNGGRYFGIASQLTGGYYQGLMDDIGIWDRALTQCEIQEIYNAQLTIDNNVSQAGAVLTSDQAGATYQWLDCDNNYSVINGETNQSYTPAVTGNYAVEVSLNGCIDTSTCYLVDYTGIEELIQGEKELIKIVDLMGREVPYEKNKVLIYVYSDGTTERIFEFE